MARPAPEVLDANRDPVRRIRLERDPLIDSVEMRRPSDLLSNGSGTPEQFCLFTEHAKKLRFAIRRHRASKLHTDFRLEAFGRLLSWASYKKPGFAPRSAIDLREMGDHQRAYLESERRIPDGGYGAGPTLVWDRGIYRPLHRTHLTDEQTVVAALRAGGVDLWLEGKLLTGGFRLELGTKGWWWTKLDDEHATEAVMPWPDVSVISKKSLDDFEAEYQAGLLLARGASANRPWHPRLRS